MDLSESAPFGKTGVKKMGYFSKNIELIKNIRPILYSRLGSFIEGQVLSEFNDSAEMEKERSKKISRYDGARILVFDGVGSGHHIFDFLETRPSHIKHFILVEKYPQIFLAALNFFDFTNLISSPDFDFMIGLEERQMTAVLKEYYLLHDRIIFSKKIGHYYFYPSLDRDGAYYLEFSKSLNVAAEQLSSIYLAPGEDCYRGLLNVVENFSCFGNSYLIDDFKNQFKNCPAVIVSTGPSLKFNLKELKSYQNRFLIVCADSALKILLKEGVIPHLVFSIERHPDIFHLIGDVPGSETIPLVALSTTSQKVLSGYRGPKIIISRESTFGKWLWPQATYFNLGGCVASMAYRILVYLGCSSISLLGQDLGYERGTFNTHVSGIGEQVSKAVSNMKNGVAYAELMGNNGQLLPSTYYWKQYKEQLENFIVKFGVETYNVIPADYGSKINNANRIEPQEFWNQIKNGKEVNLNISLENLKSHFKTADVNSDLLVEQTVSYLEDICGKTLHLMDEISLVFLHHTPECGDEKDMKRYDVFFATWDQKMMDIIKSSEIFFESFLNPLFQSSHINILMQREALEQNKEDYSQYIMKYIDLTQDWLKQILYWCLRAKNLLILIGEGRFKHESYLPK